MEFLEWYFTKHWIISTVATPFLTLAWAVFKGLTMRALVAFMVFLVFAGGSRIK